MKEEVSFKSAVICGENIALSNTQQFGPTKREARKGSKLSLHAEAVASNHLP